LSSFVLQTPFHFYIVFFFVFWGQEDKRAPVLRVETLHMLAIKVLGVACGQGKAGRRRKKIERRTK
jgi:hypothetical protein